MSRYTVAQPLCHVQTSLDYSTYDEFEVSAWRQTHEYVNVK